MFALLILKSFVTELSHRLPQDEEGATAVEYGLMVALIAVAIIAAVTLIGTNLSAMFNSVATKLGVTA